MDAVDAWRGLAFVHPAWMVTTLAVALATARMGLEIRRRRMRGEAPGRALRARHLRFGKAAVGMVAVGFAAGPPSMIFVREQSGFDSFHAILGVITLGLYLWTGWSGRALARGDREARDVHRVAAAGALGASLLAAVAGFVLLP
jgi:Na+/proline symporter